MGDMSGAGDIGDAFQSFLGFIGTAIKSDSDRRETAFNMRQADDNSQIAAAAAADALQRGDIEAAKLRLAGSQMVGKQAVAYSAAGVDATTGTPADVAAATDAAASLDAQQAANNAAREAWGYKTQSKRYKDDVQLIRARGQAQDTQNSLTGAGQIIQTGVSAWSAAGKMGG